MIELGTRMPSFQLPDTVSGAIVRSDSLRGAKAVLVAFICNHCPYVRHIRVELAQLGRYCDGRGVKVVAISANDASRYPDDAPAEMAKEAAAAGYGFPYLYDEDQSVAKAFDAACTPDFYLFDSAGVLVYRGQFDSSRPGNGIPVTGQDLYAAIDALLEGRVPSSDQRPSVGCSIKWKPGNEPTAG